MSPEARRPLRSRETRWAAALARTLLRLGFRPNGVSMLSVVFAAGAFICLLSIPRGGPPGVLPWIAAAILIQLRLLCNLMDGLLAVEGGLRTPDGDLYNEFPDRLSDPLILVGLGYAAGDELSRTLGWLCGTGAILTAAVRLHGATLTGQHDFRGPLAKPQRMALATAACLVLAVLAAAGRELPVIPWTLGGMLAGILITVGRRLAGISRTLRSGSGP